MSLLLAILLALIAYLGLKLRSTRRMIGQLVEAARSGKPVLLEQTGPFIRGTRLDQLNREINRLVAEHASISTSGKETFARIQTTLGNLREAVLMVDRESIIGMANPAFSELVQGSEDPLGKRLDQFIQGEEFHEFLGDVRKDGVGRRKELEVMIGPDTRWLEVSAAPLQETQGDPESYTLFVFHDITRQKRLEMMRTEFVANVSHELKTPVTVIKGFAETLLEDDAILTPEEKTRFLKKIRGNSERLHYLLQDLLLLSRLESTEMVLQLEAFSLRPFLKELTESWESIIVDENHQLILELCAGDDVIIGDPLRLSQVVTNLLDNVVRHAKGFRTVRVETKLREGGVSLFVKDDGAGIPEQDLPHVFQRFYRVEKGRSRESGGTGLGLSIVKHIVVQHRGKIHAASGKGKGTTIEIFLPKGQGALKEAVRD